MRIRRTVSNHGGVLVVTIIICALLGLMLAAYLSMISGQQTFTQRSQVWNNCIPICEAGVEEALAHLNHNLTTSNFAINGWVLSGGAYRKERTLGEASYVVSIDTNYPPAIRSTGRLQAPTQTNLISRTIQVQTKINQQFPNAILSKSKIICGGGGRIDSFNSTNLLESVNGQYSALLATDRAKVTTTSRTPGDISVGNVSIYGSVGTGPGGTVVLQPIGNVGSTIYNNNPAYNGTIEPGHIADDVNVYIPDGQLPVPFGPTWTPGAGNLGATNYTYLLDREGDYQINSISLGSGQKMMITAKVRLYVVGTTSVGGGSGEVIIGNGGSVEWYAGGDVSLAGKGLINVPGLAKNFSLIGLNSCHDVTYAGSSQFIGTVYAPAAKVTITGTADAFGALAGKEVDLNGTFSFHYDEALQGSPKRGRFLAASWQEL
ncbi:MAG: hypothetical protein L0Y58_20240 [Verrucomicrobia subdivision 3 bacterium]|nr:hypothetical protein [Limisphaerales bacterium]